METFLIRNAALCNTCNQEIESFYRHDFKKCRCGKIGVDGGLDYCRRLYDDGATYEDKSIYSDAPFETIREWLPRLGYGVKEREDYGILRATRLKNMSDSHLEKDRKSTRLNSSHT